MSTIPASTNRVHLMPYWRGDSYAAIAAAARARPGHRFVDVNQQVCADEVMCLHWGTAGQNGYRFITVKGEKRRAMTKEELHRPISKWHASDVRRWRQTARWGRSYQSRVKPHSFAEMAARAKKLRVVLCPELKSRAFATEPKWAQRMDAQAKALKVVFYPMTLVTMWGWGPKLRNFHNVGRPGALLAHGAKRPADINAWRPFIGAVWGRFKGGLK